MLLVSRVCRSPLLSQQSSVEEICEGLDPPPWASIRKLNEQPLRRQRSLVRTTCSVGRTPLPSAGTTSRTRQIHRNGQQGWTRTRWDCDPTHPSEALGFAAVVTAFFDARSVRAGGCTHLPPSRQQSSRVYERVGFSPLCDTAWSMRRLHPASDEQA